MLANIHCLTCQFRVWESEGPNLLAVSQNSFWMKIKAGSRTKAEHAPTTKSFIFTKLWKWNNSKPKTTPAALQHLHKCNIERDNFILESPTLKGPELDKCPNWREVFCLDKHVAAFISSMQLLPFHSFLTFSHAEDQTNTKINYFKTEWMLHW